MLSRAMLFPLVGLVLGATALSAQSTAPVAINACYVPLTGTVYRIMESRLPSDCVSDDHVHFRWTDDEDAMRVGDAAGGDLAGDYPDVTVAGLRGRALAEEAPAVGDLLAWDGQTWRPTAGASGMTSPNGMYGIAVTDDGLVLTGFDSEIRMDANGLLVTGFDSEIRMDANGLVARNPGAEIHMDPDGVVLTDSFARVELTRGTIELTADSFLRIRDGFGSEILTGPVMRITGAGALEVTGGALLELSGAILSLNGCSYPVAVQGVSHVVSAGVAGALPVMNGLPTVCAGRGGN